MSKKLDTANLKLPIAVQLLLKAPLWSKDSFMMDFMGDWGVSIKPSEASNNDNFVFELDGSIVAISFRSNRVPEEKANFLVANSYEWSDAKEIVDSHEANIIVLCESITATSKENAINAAKVVCSLALHPTVTAIEVGGALISPMHYRNNAHVLVENQFPATCFVHYGVWRKAEDAKPSAFTAGLSELGFPEVEVIESGFNADFLKEFLEKLSVFLINNDLILEDGDILSPQGEGIKVEVSKGVVFEDVDTVKLTF